LITDRLTTGSIEEADFTNFTSNYGDNAKNLDLLSLGHSISQPSPLLTHPAWSIYANLPERVPPRLVHGPNHLYSFKASTAGAPLLLEGEGRGSGGWDPMIYWAASLASQPLITNVLGIAWK